MATFAPGDAHLPTVGIRDISQFTDLTLLNSHLINLRLCHTGSEETTYYVSNSSVKPNIPDITVYEGQNREASIVGVCHLTVAGTNTVGVGDYSERDTNNGMEWEMLRRTSNWTHAKYHYDFCFGNGLETRTKFEWRRVMKSIGGAYCLQLIELSNPGVVLGALVPGPGMRVKIRGRILIRKGHGEAWERMALLTALALVELTRRRARARKYP
jgi:hypothetical protein